MASSATPHKYLSLFLWEWKPEKTGVVGDESPLSLGFSRDKKNSSLRRLVSVVTLSGLRAVSGPLPKGLRRILSAGEKDKNLWLEEVI